MVGDAQQIASRVSGLVVREFWSFVVVVKECGRQLDSATRSWRQNSPESELNSKSGRGQWRAPRRAAAGGRKRSRVGKPCSAMSVCPR